MFVTRSVIRLTTATVLGSILAALPAAAENNNLPTTVPGLGTFSGDLSARRFPGNGIYFSYDGNDRCYCPSAAKAPGAARPGAKIINMENAQNAVEGDDTRETARSNARMIDMEDAQSSMDCNNPGDVCVIRP